MTVERIYVYDSGRSSYVRVTCGGCLLVVDCMFDITRARVFFLNDELDTITKMFDDPSIGWERIDL